MEVKPIADGSPANLNTLKGRMQAMIGEMSKYKDLYLINAKVIEEEKDKKTLLINDVNDLKNKLSVILLDFEDLNSKLAVNNEKFEETVKGADDCERQRRALEHRRNIDEDRLSTLEQFIRETSDAAIDSEKKCDEVSRRLAGTEAELERLHKRKEVAEKKVKDYQSEIKALSNKLKDMQNRVEKASDLEEKYEKTIEDLKARLKNTNTRVTDSDALARKLQYEADKIKNELNQTRMNYQSLLKTGVVHQGIKTN